MALTLLEMLREAGLITREQFDEALLNRVVYGGKIGTSLIELGMVEEETLARFLSKKLAVPYVHPDQLENIPADIIQKVPRGLAIKYKVVPIRCDKKRLSLAMADPADLSAIDEIAFITDYIIRPLVAPEVRLLQALNRYYDYEIEERYQAIIARMKDWRGSAAEAEAEQQAHAEQIDEDELEEAVIVEDDEDYSERVGQFSIDDVSRQLADARSREEIGDILLGYLGQEFDRAALMVCRGDHVDGWKAVNGTEVVEAFPQMVVDLAQPSVIKTVVEGNSPYLGGLPPGGENDRLIAALGGKAPTAALLLPVQLGGRVVNVIYVDGGEGLGERMADLNRLVRKTVLAFEILIRREKILQT